MKEKERKRESAGVAKNGRSMRRRVVIIETTIYIYNIYIASVGKLRFSRILMNFL